MMPTIFPVTCHTEYVGQGSIFVVINGFKQNGIEYIPQALEKGACGIVVEHTAIIPVTIIDCIKKFGATISYVDNTRLALAQLSAHAAGNPAKHLTVIGVTGTKGKTTTTFLTAHLLHQAGYKTAFTSTVHNAIGDQIFNAPLTTAQPDYLHQFLKLCVESGVTHVVMEVAAQALTLHRVDGIQFDVVAFTNFAQEHLEFYADMDAYFTAKQTIFAHRKTNGIAIINGDDAKLAPLSQQYDNCLQFGQNISEKEGYRITVTEKSESSLTWHMQYDHKEYDATSNYLLGTFNSYNATAAWLAAQAVGVDAHTALHALSTFQSVPGRMEKYQLANGAICIIDYAHNPLSYQALLSLLRDMTKHLIVVFGAGGERDPLRRPLMGNAAAQYADYIVLTADNPRSEDPYAIIADIKSGISETDQQEKVVVEIDRAHAIQKAYAQSRSGSIIAILGKGSETYQQIGTTKHFYSDKLVVTQL